MAKEKITGSEALMRSLEQESRPSSVIRAGQSCLFSMRCMIIGIN